jgi:predicted transcriptional regulator
VSETSKKLLQVQLSDNTYRMLQTLAERRELSKSDIVRQAIRREAAEWRIAVREERGLA